MAAAHAAENARLKEIRVLVFVDQNVVVESTDAIGELCGLLEHQRPEEQQVIVVDEIALRFAARVLGEDADDVAAEFRVLRKLVGEDVVHRSLGVEMSRVDVVQRFFFRESLFLFAVAEVGARELDEIFGVALVEDREVAREAGLGSELSEQAMASGVKRSAVHLRGRRSDEPLGAAQHFLRGAPSEGEEKDAIGANAFREEVRDAVDECAGLPGSCAGDYEEWASAVRGCCGLLAIELRGKVARRRGAVHGSLARRIEAQVIRHAGQYSSGKFRLSSRASPLSSRAKRGICTWAGVQIPRFARDDRGLVILCQPMQHAVPVAGRSRPSSRCQKALCT